MVIGSQTKIVLITSGQPSLNPRLVKEADSLTEAGYQVTVIYQHWNAWGSALDKALLSKKKWAAKRIGGSDTEETFIYWGTRIIYKISSLLTRYFGFNYGLAELAVGRCGWLLYKKAKNEVADLYIAHNLAALPAAVRAAKKAGKKCGFDAEDFHRYEVSDNTNSFDSRLKVYLENKYLPKVSYLTTASPNISEAYKKLYPSLSPITILNVFPRPAVLQENADFGQLKLFWFSQTIGLDRGLKDIISAITQSGINSHIQLHILGKASEETRENITTLLRNSGTEIHFYQPIDSDKIIEFASQFDIGLAIETGEPINRNICLTNKIFTYIQAGLAVIASDTLAQQSLLNEFPGIGTKYKRGSPEQLKEVLLTYYNDKGLLKSHQKNALDAGREKLNWDLEQNKFLNVIQDVFDES